MKAIRCAALGLVVALATLAIGCVTEPAGNNNSNMSTSPSPSASPSPVSSISKAIPVPSPVLDALFSDEAFKTNLKSKVELTDDQLAQLQKIAGEEVARLRQSNVEAKSAEDQSLQAEQSRQRAAEAIRGVIGEQKANDLFALASDYWVKGNEGSDSNKTNKEPKGATGEAPENTLLPGPNAVPKDTRVVVNIPAFRMDVFKEGSLVKSYKIGIGYPEFPLPTGLRKAQTIIFNPTWTPPDSPWVESMKDVLPGETVEAGSALNPLGPIKIPIGMPSLIHGGKSPAKLGTFASHGCVGLTTPQVRDFAKTLAQLGGTRLTDAALAGYARDKTETKQLKLGNAVPVELRYETIVVEDGKLHIYRDVYDQDTNTEENLRAVFEANGVKLEDLTEEERGQVLDALAQLAGKLSASIARPTPIVRPGPSPVLSPNASASEGVKKIPVTKKPRAVKNQKEIVIEIAALKGKGYPAPVDLDTGSGKTKTALASTKPLP